MQEPAAGAGSGPDRGRRRLDQYSFFGSCMLRKRKKAAAIKRHFKRVRSMQLPKKLY